MPSYPLMFDYVVLDQDGKLAVGGTIEAFYSGTDIPAIIYNEAGNPIDQPLVFGSDARAFFKLGATHAYRIRAKDVLGAQIYQRDGVTGASSGGGGGAVSSVFGRTGDVMAESGDYSSGIITNDSTVTGATVTDALETLAGDALGYLKADGTVEWTGTQLPAMDNAIDLGASDKQIRRVFSRVVTGTGTAQTGIIELGDDSSGPGILLSSSNYIDVRQDAQFWGDIYPDATYTGSIGTLNRQFSAGWIRELAGRNNAGNIQANLILGLGNGWQLSASSGVGAVGNLSADGGINITTPLLKFANGTIVSGATSSDTIFYQNGPGGSSSVSLAPSELDIASDGKVVIRRAGAVTPISITVDGTGISLEGAKSGILATAILSLDANGAMQSGAISTSTIGAEPALGNPSVSGQVLASTDAGVRSWQTLPAVGMTNPMTAMGDIIIGGASGAPFRLGIASNNYILRSDGSTPGWFDLFGAANTWTGAQTLNGAVTLGDASGDAITVNGSIASNLLPTGNRNLGSSTAQWSAIFANAFSTTRSLATNTVFESIVTGDSNYRFSIFTDGKFNWGPGNAAFDTNLYRSAADTLKTDDALIVTRNLTNSTLSGTGTRMVVANYAGTLDTQAIPSGGSSTWAIKTANHTATSGEQLLSDTSGGAFAITLPATPSAGDNVRVMLSCGSGTVNTLTIGRNGSTIEGAAADVTMTANRLACTFIYTGSDWRLYNG